MNRVFDIFASSPYLKSHQCVIHLSRFRAWYATYLYSHIDEAITDDALVRVEMPNLVHAVATLVKCIAFYITMRALKVLVVDVLRVDLGPAAEAFVGELRSHAKAPNFHTQGGNWSSEEVGQEKRGI
ncbi:hypothetical protein E4T43_01743 [Aureobasidium subglaciale]|nr:hypothetical protein E4T43_01743 [Aureobasidium subglaciale]